MIAFDHLKLVRRQPTEVARFRRWLLQAAPGELSEMRVLHEHDDRCCRKEAWNVTAAALIGAMNPPTPQVMVNLLCTPPQQSGSVGTDHTTARRGVQ